MATIWNAGHPLSSTEMSGSTEQIRINWDAIQDWWQVGHAANFSGATSGTHVVGLPGVMACAASATIAALTNPGTGALAWNASNGELYFYRYDSTNLSAGWERLTAQKFSRLRVTWGSQSIAASTWTQVTATSASTTSGQYDTLSEFSEVTDKIIPLNTGWYLVTCNVRFPATSSLYSIGGALYLNGSAVSRAYTYGNHVRNWIWQDVVRITTASSDYLQLYCWHNHTSSTTIIGASVHFSRLL